MGLTNDEEYTFQLRAVNAVGAGTAVEADSATPRSGVCGRTEQVRDAIVAAIDGVSDCADVTTAQLAGVTYLGIPYMGIRSLQSDDFSGLTALTAIRLDNNELSSLPPGVFTGLTSLTGLYLYDNALSLLPDDVFTDLTSLEKLQLQNNALSLLPAGVFTGLTSLTQIILQNNALSSLPDDPFTGLTALKNLRLQENQLGSLPAGVFTGLTSLERIYLEDNALSSLPDDPFTGLTALVFLHLNDNALSLLPAGVFTGLTALQDLRLYNNALSLLPDDPFTGLTALKNLWLDGNALSLLPADMFTGLTALIILRLNYNELSLLPADVFTGLTALTHLWLQENQLGSLPAGVFTDLTELWVLDLYGNELSLLPAGVFTGLTKLQRLWLKDNELSSLPAGAFTGLTALRVLRLDGNTEDPLPLTVTLEKVGSDQVRAEVPMGAPFAVDIPVMVANGALAGGANTLGVAVGSVEGTPVMVTRTAGTTAAVTADIDLSIQPTLPDDHAGYIFARAASGLPKEVLPSTDANAVVTIESDDSLITEDAGAAGFTLSRTGSTAATLTVTVAVTQQVDRDLLPDGAEAERTVTFAVGSATATLSVELENDDLKEAAGDLTVEVRAGSGYTVGDPASATVKVSDVDTGRPTPANLRASVGAGVGEVVLSWDAHAPYLGFARHQYRYKTDGDYPAEWTDSPNSGQHVDAAGDGSNLTGYTVTGLVGGQVHTFEVRTYGSSSSASDPSDEATATPRSAVVSFGAESYSVDEGGTVAVTVQLDAAPGREVVVPVSAVGAGGATPPGETGADWSGVPENVTFGATDTARTFTLTATDDTDVETGESVALSFGTLPDWATAGTPSEATVTITDAVLPMVTIAADSGVVIEEAGAADFTLSRTGSTTAALAVAVAVTQQVDRDLLPDGAAAERTVMFAVGSATAALSVELENDDLLEARGELTVEVRAGSGYTVGDPGSATVDVTDVDTGLPTPANLMAEAGAGAGVGEVVLSWDPHAPYLEFARHQYRYKTDGDYPAEWIGIPNSGQHVDAAGDGSNLTGYTVTGLVGGQVHTFEVRTNFATDTSDPSDEATATPRSAVVSFGAESYSVDEGGTVAVTVQLDAAPGREVVVPVSAAGAGGATPPGETGADWSGVPENVTFGATDTEQTFTLTATDDTDVETGESVTLSFGTLPDWATAGTPSEATVTIVDADVSLPTLSVANAAAAESDGVTFTVTLSEAATDDVTATWTASIESGDTAEAEDFESTTGTVTFTPSQTTAMITVPTAGDPEDTTDEDDETFTLTLSSPSANATLASDPTATGTINDDDDPPSVSVGDEEAAEGAPVEFAVTLSAVSGKTVTVNWATSVETGDSATADTDFTAASGTLTFMPDEMEKTVAVQTTDDTLVEPDETFTVTLSSPPNAMISDATAKGTITNDDVPPDPPTDFTAKEGNMEVALAWKAPALDSGVTGHEFRYKTDGDYPLTWTAIANSAPDEANEGSFTVTMLTNEVAYTFELHAVSAGVNSDAVSAGPVTPMLGICDRTDKIQEAILGEISGEDNCATVTDENLAAITSLGAFGFSTSNQGITSLQKGDFAGLTALTVLNLSQNGLSSLPEGIFAGLAELDELNVSRNQLESLPEGVFDGLAELYNLNLSGNSLTGFPAGAFSGLTALEDLLLSNNDLNALPEDLFSGLTALTFLGLISNDLSSLPDGVFTGLTALETLYLNSNDLSSLPEVVFSGLTALQELFLYGNELNALPEDLFSGLTALTVLHLYDNDLDSLPGTVFSGLTSLVELLLSSNDLGSLPEGLFTGLTSLDRISLNDNDLNALPDGLFTGLTALNQISLGGNPTDPLPLTVTVEKVGTDQVRAKVLAGAPFAVEFAVTPVNGTLEGGATMLGVAAGEVYSTPVTVTRTAGTTAAVTVDVDLTTQPTLAAVSGSSTSLVASWTKPGRNGGPDITGYNVEYRVSTATTWNDFTHTGTTTTTTLTGLTASTSYQVRVQALNGETPSAWSDPSEAVSTEAAANNPPVFSGSMTTRTVPENSAAGTNVGAPVTAMDDDRGDTLTYSLDGTNAASFDIDEDSGQIRTISGVTYNHEEKSSYAVIVAVTDDTDRATIGVLIDIADVDEQPDQPAKPTLAVVSGSSTSLVASWTKPGRNGGPDITGYNVNYRVSTVTAWETFTHRGAGVTRTITGLTASTSYQVQVQALNGETPSAWSDPSDAVSTEAVSDAPTPEEDADRLLQVTCAIARKNGVTDSDGLQCEEYLDGDGARTLEQLIALQTQIIDRLPPGQYDYYDLAGRQTLYKAEDGRSTTTKGGSSEPDSSEPDAPPPVSPLTAHFADVPSGHDGARAFTLRVAFSEAIAIGYEAFRDHSVGVIGGAVTKARRVDKRRDLWEITVKPASDAAVSVSLSPPPACDETGAICTGDGRPLSASITAIVPGPAQEAAEPEEDQPPEEEDQPEEDQPEEEEQPEEEQPEEDPPQEPPAPQNLTGVANSDGSITLSWDAPDDDTITGYQILRRRPYFGEGKLLTYVADTGSTATSYTDTEATPKVRHVYRVKAINPAGVGHRSNSISVTAAAAKVVATSSGLAPNFPNPFNSRTLIPYRLATPGAVRLEIYNLLGQPLRTLVDQYQDAGFYKVRWDARDRRGALVSAGMYLVRLHYPGGVQTQRLLYLK